MDGPTNSDILWGKIHLAEGRLFAETHVFWNHDELAGVLPKFLIQAHGLMRRGLTMMAVARDQAIARTEDAVAVELAAYLQVHLEEELGHDLWLLDDICSLGYDEQEVMQAPLCAPLANLLQELYSWITDVHPVAILGYLILMEGYAPLVSQLEEIRMRTGLPASAFRCLKAHGEDDPAHLADLNRTLDGMTLTVEQEKAVGMCAFAAIDGLASLFEELLEAREETVPQCG